jgi:ubiquinone/menaquinone biosynthesis C-methylase UbiE
MAARITLKKGVIWYPIEKSLWVIVSPFGEGQEKCRILNQSDIPLLDIFKDAAFVNEEEIPPHARTIVEKWFSPDFPILEKSKDPRPLKDYEHLALAVFQEYRSAKELDGYHDLADYHKEQIQNPFRQFEKIETTVNHLYREGHPALGNKSYGARFAQTLLKEGSLTEGAFILEVGCGTGLFGRSFLSEIKRSASDLYGTIHYTFFDLSTAMMDSQREVNREHGEIVSFIQGNASAHDFAQATYDLIISNEMIADLPVIKLSRNKKRRKGTEGEAWALVRRLGLDLDDAPPHFVLNIGALRFLLNLSRALKPGGKAYIIEYGNPYTYPISRFMTDHREYSIHFGHLLRGARAFGLRGTLHILTDFLRFDPELEVLDSFSHTSLFNHLLPFLDIEAEAQRVYTRCMFSRSFSEVAQKVRNLAFVPLRSLKGIAYPDEFYVLKLLKETG